MVSQVLPTTIDRWKLDLVRARAVRLGFRGADLDDVQQDILIEVLSFRFQLERGSGATERTALVSLIDRRLLMARRQRRRYQQRLDQIQQWTNPEEAALDAEQAAHEEYTGRRLDIGELLGTLTPKDRALCAALAAGESIDTIARRLECSWHTVKRHIERLRTHLTVIGVDGYVR